MQPSDTTHTPNPISTIPILVASSLPPEEETPDITVRSIAFHPSRPYFVTGCGRIAKLCRYSDENPQEERCVASFNEGDGIVYSVAFNSDGSLLATGSNKSLKLWSFSADNPPVSSLSATLSDDTKVYCVAFNSDGSLLASGYNDKNVKLWSSDPHGIWTCVKTLDDHTESVNSIAFHKQHPYLLTGSNDETARLWDVSSPVSANCLATIIATINGHHTGNSSSWINSVAFHPRELLFATASEDHTAKLFKFTKEASGRVECVRTLNFGQNIRVYSVAFHPTLPYLVTGDSGDTITKVIGPAANVWDFSNESDLKRVATLKGHEQGVLCVAFNPNSIGTLATTSRDGTVKIWQTSDILGLDRSLQGYAFGRELGLKPTPNSKRITYSFKGSGSGSGSGFGFGSGGGASKKKKRGMIKKGVRYYSRGLLRNCSRRRNHRRSRKQHGRR